MYSISCNDNYPYKIKMSNISNCYIECDHYYYFDNNIYYCTSSCPEKYSKLDKKECLKNTEIKNIIHDIIKNNETITKEEEIEYNLRNYRKCIY